jgi:type IV secretion system protein VirB1
MIELILACAPNVAPHTVQEIIRVESNGNPIAVNVNTRNGAKFKHKKITTKKEAISVSKAAIAAGHTVDMGYMQVNSANLKGLGYTVADMFDPCKNLKAGAHILTTAYSDALPRHSNEQAALRAALSRYNTGSFGKGFRNGYVARYVNAPPAALETLDPYTAETSVWSQPVRVVQE